MKKVAAQDIIQGEEKQRILDEAKIHRFLFHFFRNEVFTRVFLFLCFSRLIHPHVVQFLGISLEETDIYLVLKVVHGFNLDEVIFEKKMVQYREFLPLKFFYFIV